MDNRDEDSEERREDDRENQDFRAKGVSKFDISLRGVKLGKKVELGLGYRTALFKGETIKRFTNYFHDIIMAIIKNRDTRLGDIEVTHDLITPEVKNPPIELRF
jgi:hypothetical protein